MNINKNLYPCNYCGNILCQQNCEEFDEWIYRAEEALKERERYKWHDLVKDPEDLPMHNRDVYIYTDCAHHGLGWLSLSCEHLNRYDSDIMGTIIAWREIEEFR